MVNSAWRYYLIWTGRPWMFGKFPYVTPGFKAFYDFGPIRLVVRDA